MKINMNGHDCRKVFRIALKHSEIVKSKFCSKCKRDDLPLKHFHKNFDKPLEVTWLCSECYKDTIKQRPGTFKGRHHSEDSKLSMSISHEGIIIPFKVRKKISESIVELNGTTSKVIKDESKEEIGLYRLYRRYKRSTNKRKHFLLTIEEFKEITQQNCFYCGGEPKQSVHRRNDEEKYVYNGIDRINSNLGYVKGNVVPCCKMCNSMKFTYTQEDFFNHIKKIVDYSNIQQRRVYVS